MCVVVGTRLVVGRGTKRIFLVFDGVGVGGVGVGMIMNDNDNVPCTCTHGRCYAIGCFLHLHTWSMLHHRMFLALAHMVDVTP